MAGDSQGEYRGLAYRNEAELKAWLAKRPSEAALEPALPIIDPHHHFWDTPQRGRYLLPELLADIGNGHNIVSTVFLECRSMYRKDGPAELAPVGEVEFVNGIAAMSASGGYGQRRDPEVRDAGRSPASGARPQIPRGLRPARPLRPQLRILAVSSAIAGRDRSGTRLPRHHDHPQPCRRRARCRPLFGPSSGDSRRLEEGHRRIGEMPERQC